MIKKAAIIALAFALTGCDLFESGVSYTLDNPTDKAISVKLDGKDYNLEAKGSTKVELKSGDHTIAYGDETAAFYLFEGSRGGLINPTLSNYYVNYIFYKTSNDGYDGDKMAEEMLFRYRNTDTILGTSFSGHYFKFNHLLIEKLGDTRGWIMDVNESYPESMSSTSAIKVVGKIFREGDFINFIASEYGEKLAATPGYREPVRRFSDLSLFYPPLGLTHECAQIADYFTTVNKQLEAMQSASTASSKRKEVKKEMQLHNIAMMHAKNACPKKDFNITTTVNGYSSRSFDSEARSKYEAPEKQYSERMSWIMERSLFLLK